jgi:phospholipid/cholesterol/gamma-HCH transport system substrate-binding protein
MERQDKRNLKLGIMVMAGTAFLLFTLYFIGNDQNMFRNTFRVYVDFKNVNGLMKGNTVRYAGIDVGSVKEVTIISDTVVRVGIVLQEKARGFIKNNVLASIGTDGLMGNKLINLTPVNSPADIIVDGDVLQSLQPIETDEIFRKLNKTNEDISVIAENIRMLTEKFQHPDALISILGDTTIADHIRNAVVNVKLTSQNSARITGDLSSIVIETKAGKGLIGGLLTDTSFTDQLNQTIVSINSITDTIAEITGDFRFLSQKIRSGEGAIGAILMDTTLVPHLNRTIQNAEKSGAGVNQIIDALKQSFLFRGYFKKQEKLKSTDADKK